MNEAQPMIDKLRPKTFKIVSISLQSVIDSIRKLAIGLASDYNFKMARSEALRRCSQENRKIYVIKSGPIRWRVFSTSEVRNLKKRRIFKKELTFLEMEEKCAFVARVKPKSKTK
jgi:hypothetical protein